MMLVGLEFVLHESKQELGRGGINLAIGITNFVGRLNITIFRNDANNTFCVCSLSKDKETTY